MNDERQRGARPGRPGDPEHLPPQPASPHSSRRRFLKDAGLGALTVGLLPGMAGCSDDPVGSTPDAGPSDGSPGEGSGTDVEFMVVALPDTQYYSDHYPKIFEAQTQWIADNAKKEKIAFVTHLGDIVDNGPSLRQWKNAREAMDILDTAGVRYGTCLGNHDFQYGDNEYSYPSSLDSSCSSTFTDLDCRAKEYLDNFGPKRFTGRAWYGGASPSGQSSYQTFSVGTQDFLFLHLAVDPRVAEIAWAQTVLNKHPRAAVHLSTHRYMYDFRLVKTLPMPLNALLGGRFVDLLHSKGQPLYFKDSTSADTFFLNFIYENPNIFMVHCGHVDAEFRDVSKNKAGLPVHEILVDFQELSPKGGDGWMRLLTFNLTRGKVKVRTFSPTLGTYRKNGASLDTSISAMKIALTSYASLLRSLGLDLQKLQAQLDTWTKTAAGKAELAKLLYEDGRRDSEFTLDVSFSSYRASS